MLPSVLRRIKKALGFRLRVWRTNQLCRKSQKVFVTFADGVVHTSTRLAAEIASTNSVDMCVRHSPETLETEFYSIHGEHLKHKRGWGYWCWKPWIIRIELQRLRDGDFLIYADSGCSISPSRELADVYQAQFSVVLRSLLAKFVDQPGLELVLPSPSEDWRIVEWTKGDLLDQFGVRQNDVVLQKRMMEAGRMLLRRTPRVMQFLDDWCNVAADFQLISDTPSIAPELPSFRENRHDQAIFNLLLGRLSWTTGLEHLLHSTRYKD